MSYLLIPHDVTETEAKLWLGAINEAFNPADVTIESLGRSFTPDAAWRHWKSQDGDNELHYRYFNLVGMDPGRTYPLALRIRGELQADGEVTTLPIRVPAAGQKPFTVFLGSCFSWREDEDGKAGNTFYHMPTPERPHIKILCGDQVYLDAPWREFLLALPHREPELERRFFENYRKTWTQSGFTSGYQQILKRGANYLSSDDHEFWNNAPNPSFANNTWTQTGRDTWLALARNFFRMFQTEDAVKTFSVGGGALSFCIADTRINRDPGRDFFMFQSDFDKVAAWIAGLQGPGVLVVGQPILTKKTSFFKGNFGDWGISDYRQYDDLLRLIKSATQSLVLLTGDVHYGRVASAQLRPELGTKLIEVISSPLSLVDEKAAGTWEPAPEVFRRMQTEKEFASNRRHFLTLEFSAIGNKHVSMLVKFWPIVPNGQIPRSTVVYKTQLS